MASLHTWAGLLLGWILYAMFLTGTVSYFKDELSQWMRPELRRLAQIPDQAVVAQRIADELGKVAAGTSRWSMRLPDARNNSVAAFWLTPTRDAGQRAFGDAYFDPATGRKVASRDTLGGDFFYRFHFQFHYMPVVWGRWLAGAAAMFMLVAIVSGVITHKKIFVDFFTFRWRKGQRSWLDAHNALSVFGLPFHFMITYTGLVTLMALYMPWGERVAFKTPAERQQLAAELSGFIQPGRPSGQKVPLASVADMVRQAQERWGQDNVGRVNAVHPGDAAARVAVTRGEVGRVSLSPQYMEFDGTTGKLLTVRESVGAAAETRGVLYALHLGRFSDLETRWLYFLVSFMGTAMVGTGLVMWTVKRRQKLPDPDHPHFGFRLVERLNIASIAGLSVAMTAFLWANRLLPHALENRADWEIHAFFIVWLLTLLHALLRPAKSAWIEQLWAASALLFLLPVLNTLTTQRPFWHSLSEADWVFVGMDIMCWALALLHAVLAIRTARQRAGGRSRRDIDRRAPNIIASGEVG
ncbi:PepSY-associated TM helix domain-containing protein [Bradyrhizobium sp. LHD-71]|uniref:PepSY-associated TM helix domain-containing protein n=1 Tax=Bradyrhizobium sp. LHD-71 TaxID=3072141 RepID=UPI00280FCB08|nr:PepSY-associated TM helix domain-containing protein [Bradyrhizobium sp. LHD-71]MDQ8730071.1 PepSY-associated TM helix domain-containing protein [Bradyrhizobium sp. LHD-71]